MKKIICIITILILILSSTTLCFADSSSYNSNYDYSWLIGKTITFNDSIDILYDPNYVWYQVNFRLTSNDEDFKMIYFYNNDRMVYKYNSGSDTLVYRDGHWIHDNFKQIVIISLPSVTSESGSDTYRANLEDFINWLFANSNAYYLRPVYYDFSSIFSFIGQTFSTFNTAVSNNQLLSTFVILPCFYFVVVLFKRLLNVG